MAHHRPATAARTLVRAVLATTCALCLYALLAACGAISQTTKASPTSEEAVAGTQAGDETAADIDEESAATEGEEAGDEGGTHRRIIIDTDSGADDCSAIILAATDPAVEIVGVTVCVGNVGIEEGARNALMALEVAGSDAPVYRGSTTTFSGREHVPYSVFGTDGMGDLELVRPKGKPQEQDAVDFILDTVRANPDEIEIVSLAPVTNIAKAIEADPEAMSHVKRIWSMGTAGLGPGNASPVAEFNVYHDAEAYQALVQANIPLTVVGLDMCNGDALIDNEHFARLERTSAAGRFVALSFAKIRQYFVATGRTAGIDDCDAIAMTCALDDDFVLSTKRCAASCITEPGETYAEVLFYQDGLTYDSADDITKDLTYNVTLVTDVDRGAFFDRLRDTLAALGWEPDESPNPAA